MGIKGATLETVELETYPTGAMEVGKYTFSLAGGQVADSGKYIVIWKQKGGAWKCHRDIWNSSLPACLHLSKTVSASNVMCVVTAQKE
jgi:ketosteroid isomerase-like protein